MVKIRLKRMGSKFNPFYRIVASDSRAPRDGRFIEKIGYYDPHSKEVFVDEEIKNKWLTNGALVSETVKHLFKKFNQALEAKKVKDGKFVLEVKVKKPKKKNQVETLKEEVKETLKKEEQPEEKQELKEESSNKEVEKDNSQEKPKEQKVDSKKEVKENSKEVKTSSESKSKVKESASQEKTTEKEQEVKKAEAK